MKRTKILRVDEQFEEMINDMARKRITNRMDKKMKSPRRLTLAISRHPLIKNIENDIINADLD